MMPVLDGFGLAAAVRSQDCAVPVLFMTARDDMPSKQRGFRLGIDDYLVKPFDTDELIMRVKAILRRANINASKKLELGNLVMDEDEHTAYVNGEELPLTVREFDILFKLLSFPKKNFHPRKADGGPVGLRQFRHFAHGRRVHGKTARKNGGVRRL